MLAIPPDDALDACLEKKRNAPLTWMRRKQSTATPETRDVDCPSATSAIRAKHGANLSVNGLLCVRSDLVLIPQTI